MVVLASHFRDYWSHKDLAFRLIQLWSFFGGWKDSLAVRSSL